MNKLAIFGGEKAVQFSTPVDPYLSEAWYRGERTGIEKLAEAFTEYTGASYALPVKSGTAALAAGLAAAGVEAADEVIVVSFTYLASVASILLVNAVPVFADVDRETFTIDPADIVGKITERTKAIMPVDIYGHPADMDAIMEIARAHQIQVVEDACQATGAEINGRRLGSIADITAFSFSGKPLSSTSGGVLTTHSREAYERACLYGQHPVFLNNTLTNPGLRRFISTGGHGDNHRIDMYASTLAYERLQRLDENNQARIENAQYLADRLKGFAPVLRTPSAKPGYKHVYHAFTLLYDEVLTGVKREKFVDALIAEGVPVLCYMTHCNYPAQGGKPIEGAPIYHGAIFQDLNLYGKGCPFQCPLGKTPSYRKGSLPVSEDLCTKELNIMQQALDKPLTTAHMEQYVTAFEKVLDAAITKGLIE